MKKLLTLTLLASCALAVNGANKAPAKKAEPTGRLKAAITAKKEEIEYRYLGKKLTPQEEEELAAEFEIDTFGRKLTQAERTKIASKITPAQVISILAGSYPPLPEVEQKSTK